MEIIIIYKTQEVYHFININKFGVNIWTQFLEGLKLYQLW